MIDEDASDAGARNGAALSGCDDTSCELRRAETLIHT